MTPPPSEENDDIEALKESEVPKAEAKISDDQDQLAAEWEEMTSNTEATRVLNQD